MKTLIIYDNEGYVITAMTGNYRLPVGIPFLEVEIPAGKRLKDGIGLDVTADPHEAIFEDIPPTETQLLIDEVNSLKAENAAISYALMMEGII